MTEQYKTVYEGGEGEIVEKKSRFIATVRPVETEEEALAWYKTYGDQMALEFPLKPNAKETVNALHDMGHTIVLATARATDWHVEPERITLEWLDKNGIKYDKIYLGRVDKEQICIDENADVFVDDDIKICTKVLVHTKTKAYLTKTDFNSTFEKPL